MGKNDDFVPQSIIFPLSSGNIISSHKKLWKCPIPAYHYMLKNARKIYEILKNQMRFLGVNDLLINH